MRNSDVRVVRGTKGGTWEGSALHVGAQGCSVLVIGPLASPGGAGRATGTGGSKVRTPGQMPCAGAVLGARTATAHGRGGGLQQADAAGGSGQFPSSRDLSWKRTQSSPVADFSPNRLKSRNTRKVAGSESPPETQVKLKRCHLAFRGPLLPERPWNLAIRGQVTLFCHTSRFFFFF